MQFNTVKSLVQDVELNEEKLRNAPFELRRKLIEALDIRGEVTPKGDGRVLRAKWYKHSHDFGLDNRIASSSASESAAAPWSRRRSRGFSLAGSSLMRRWYSAMVLTP